MADKPIDSRDYVTLVSLIPSGIREIKPGLNPGTFTILACKDPNFPEVLHITEASFPIYAGEGRHIIQRVMPEELAKSIISDYNLSQPLTGPDAKPGLFYVKGIQTKEEVKIKFESQLKEAGRIQRNWFENIIREADDMWQKYHQHSLISEFQRQACLFLGWDREWISIAPENNPERCKFCGSMLKPAAVVCLECKQVTNIEEFKKRGGVLQSVGA